MRVLQICDVELDELRKTISWRDGINDGERKSGAVGSQRVTNGNEGGNNERMVCVTSWKSLVGSAIVHHLLSQGYSVRITVQTHEDVEKVKEMSQTTGRDVMSTVVGDSMNIDTLCQAFEGCFGVFHTSAVIDPSGVSGYTKYMADTEARVAKLVVDACARTESVRKCVFTSSLLACVWQQRYPDCPELPYIVDERCWSDESLCRDKKLWYALGKTMAERAAWSVARAERKNLKLVTLCPALVTGQQNSIPYLKGAQEMLAEGLLATVCVDNVAEATSSFMRRKQLVGGTFVSTIRSSPELKRLNSYSDNSTRQPHRTSTNQTIRSLIGSSPSFCLVEGDAPMTLIPTCIDTLY